MKILKAQAVVSGLFVRVTPLRTKDGDEIHTFHVSVSKGKKPYIISARGKRHTHMGAGFFNEEFDEDTLKKIRQIEQKASGILKKLKLTFYGAGKKQWIQ